MAHPPRSTVFGLSWYAAPIRGWKLFRSSLNGDRDSPFSPAKPIPPYTLYPGNFAWLILSEIGLTTVEKKSRFTRLKRSVTGDVISHRSPRFSVSLRLTLISSCTHGAV